MRGRLDSAGWGWEGVELVERCFVRVVVSWLCRVEEREVKSCVKTDSTVPSHNTAWRRGRGEGRREEEKRDKGERERREIRERGRERKREGRGKGREESKKS